MAFERKSSFHPNYGEDTTQSDCVLSPLWGDHGDAKCSNALSAEEENVVLLLVKLGNQPLLPLSFPNLLPFRYRIKLNTFWTLWQLWVAVHSFNTFNQHRVTVAELPREWALKTPACCEFCLCDLGRAVLPFKVVFTISSFVKTGKWQNPPHRVILSIECIITGKAF